MLASTGVFAAADDQTRSAGKADLQATINEQASKSEELIVMGPAFRLHGSYIGDFYGNALGGLQTGVGFVGKANIGFKLRLWGFGVWPNVGCIVASGNAIHGRSPSLNYLGDWQVASNIDGGGNFAYVNELFFSQRIGFGGEGKGLTFNLGLQDLGAEFMVLEEAYRFINSSFGVPSTAATGMPLPIFPQTGLGFTVAWDIDRHFTLKAAVFDGYSTPLDDGNPANMKWSLGRDDGALVFGEFQSRVELGRKRLPGEYKIGGYYHTGLRADEIHDDGVRERVEIFPYNWGVYLTADQRVYDSDRHELCLFAQLNAGPKKFNENHYYAGFGTSLVGVFSKQKRDAVGLAVAHAGLWRARPWRDGDPVPSLAPGMDHSPAVVGWDHETTLELYYKYRFNKNIVLQPDLQYIINPSGTEAALPNALLCTLRLKLEF